MVSCVPLCKPSTWTGHSQCFPIKCLLEQLDQMMTRIYYLFKNSWKNKRLIIQLTERLSVTWVSFVSPKGTRFQAHHYHGIRVMIVNYGYLTLANNKTCKPDLNQPLVYGYLGALELYRTVLHLTSHLMKVQGILVTDVLDGLEECKQELKVLAASPERVFPFSCYTNCNSNNSAWHHTVQRKSKIDRKAEESRQMHLQSWRNLRTEESCRGKTDDSEDQDRPHPSH